MATFTHPSEIRYREKATGADTREDKLTEFQRLQQSTWAVTLEELRWRSCFNPIADEKKRKVPVH
jgi:hypothetical protein